MNVDEIQKKASIEIAKNGINSHISELDEEINRLNEIKEHLSFINESIEQGNFEFRIGVKKCPITICDTNVMDLSKNISGCTEEIDFGYGTIETNSITGARKVKIPLKRMHNEQIFDKVMDNCD